MARGFLEYVRGGAKKAYRPTQSRLGNDYPHDC